MPLWIIFTLLAAFAQNVRSALQRRLAADLTATGASYVRFLYGLPFAALYLAALIYFTGEALPQINAQFVLAVLVGGAAQVVAAVLLVRMFALRVFTVGTTYSKTETVQTALIGFLVLGEVVGPYAFAGILVSFIGVIALSVARTAITPRSIVASLGSPVALMGLGCGAGFAVASVCYRAASLSLDDTGFAVSAAMTLTCVLVWQTLIMTVWLGVRDRASLKQSYVRWRPAVVVGIASVIGSIGWFTAFALENAAYVKALGQIELVFALATSTLIFKEKTNRGELLGIGLVVAGLVLIVL
ncbi:DMT family transporter [Pyruvatibacter sp.]|uniref:DMT family transporter n=1 Tax=Pyruvatibacter sp. TaxID=1981328 RepID=UPI0032EDA46D